MHNILLLFLTATVAGLLAKRSKVPAGAMVGALLASACFSILFGKTAFPFHLSVYAQIISGIFIGKQIDRSILPSLRRLFLPAVFSVALMILLSSLLAYFVAVHFAVDIATSMLANAPGGITDMALIGMDLQADTAVISMIHTFRALEITLVFPHIFALLTRRKREEKHTSFTTPQSSAVSAPMTNEKGSSIIFTGVVGLICGSIGAHSNIPAGALLFSLVGVAVQSVIGKNAAMPSFVRTGAQIFVGASVGSGITIDVLSRMKTMLFPVLIMLTGYLIINLIVATLLEKFAKMEKVTALFASTPGGLISITLMAGDYGADTAQVSIFHIVRSVSVVLAYPLLFFLFL